MDAAVPRSAGSQRLLRPDRDEDEAGHVEGVMKDGLRHAPYQRKGGIESPGSNAVGPNGRKSTIEEDTRMRNAHRAYGWLVLLVSAGVVGFAVWAQPGEPAAQPAKPVVELRAGSSQPKGDLIADAADKYAEVVNQRSKGEVVIRVFYQSLGVEQQLTQAVMSGSVDIGMLSNGNSGRFTSAFFLYDLPFLFKKYENMLKVLESPLGKTLQERAEKDLGVKYLFHMSLGLGRDIQTTRKPLRTPADIKGLKIRVVSTPIDLATFKAWGANPTPVDWSQTFTALQQGVVEGEQIPISVIAAIKHHEVVKYSIRLDYQALFETFFINAKKFASLSPAHQQVLLEAAREVKVWQHKDAAERAQKAMHELTTKYGMQIYTPTPEEYAQWASIRERVWQQVAEEQKGKIDLVFAKQLFESQ
jgi:tripartite ATP-independent transporter DctP family solute receptor